MHWPWNENIPSWLYTHLPSYLKQTQFGYSRVTETGGDRKIIENTVLWRPIPTSFWQSPSVTELAFLSWLYIIKLFIK